MFLKGGRAKVCSCVCAHVFTQAPLVLRQPNSSPSKNIFTTKLKSLPLAYRFVSIEGKIVDGDNILKLPHFLSRFLSKLNRVFPVSSQVEEP